MPAFNKLYTHPSFKFNPQALQQHGALLFVEINVPKAFAGLLASQKKQVPTGVKGVALIDTGATNTCVDHAVISGLGVQPVGVINSGTAGGQVQQNLFPVNFKFPNEGLDIELNQSAGVNLQGQVAMGQPIVALIGRDLLANFIFIYNGPAGMYTITT